MKTKLWLLLSSCCIGVAALTGQRASAAGSTDAPCGQLVGPNTSGDASAGFMLRDGEAVDFIAGGQAVHGKLQVFRDGSLYRAYWQPQGSAEHYALANAGANSVRLVSTPPQGTPASDGTPGIASAPLQVLSCPRL